MSCCTFSSGYSYGISDLGFLDLAWNSWTEQVSISTGAFVEPIEVWDEPRLLRFGVVAQPPVMEEFSPYSNLRPPHLDHYLQSRKGQFLLTRLSNGTTMLEGTTWYQNRFWPGAYWNLWSDYIIQRIHLRVLSQIKQLAEQE